MACYTIKKGEKKYRLYGNYEKHSKNGRPMISLSLQIVGSGTQSLIVVSHDCFKKAVQLLKDNEINTHEDYEKILFEEFKGF
jgi:hypothetical protein